MTASRSWAPQPVHPAVDGEAIVVRLGTPSPFGSAVVEFGGDGALCFDPAAPDRLLEVRVSDPEEGEATLRVSLGNEATEQLFTPWSNGAAAEPLLPRPTQALAPLARLALGSWLEQWTPLEIPSQALTLDVATHAHAASFPLLANRAFSASVGYLAKLAQAGRARDLPDAVRFGIGEALTAATASVDPVRSMSLRLPELADSYSATRGTDAAWDLRLNELLDQEGASIYGIGIDPALGALFSVDWALVPARVLNPEEGQGHMTVDGDGVHITVTSARWLDSSAMLGLQVRLLDPDSGLSLADAPLVWDPEVRVFAVHFSFARWAEQGADALSSALPEVYAQEIDGSRPVPRIGADREAARAWRESVRALTQRRRSNACESALGVRLATADRSASLGAQTAALTLDRLGVLLATPASALRDWQSAQVHGHEGSTWPSGLLVPGGADVGRPTLAELVEVSAPELFALADR